MTAGGLQAGEVHHLRIENVAFGGAGVGRAQGMVVFVPFTAPGEEVEVKILSVRKRFALGELRSILKASAHRVAPPCRSFGKCGGCQLQHIAYSEQLVLKEKQVGEIFTRLGRFPVPPLRRIIPSPRPFHYRGKADYHIRTTAAGRFMSLGFRSLEKYNVLDIARCEIVEESINRSCEMFREALQRGEGSCRPDRRTIWSSPEEGMIVPVPADHENHPLLTRKVKGREVLVPYGGFFQVNTALVSDLVDQVLGFTDLNGAETVLDGYCGAGLFSLFLAPYAGSILGIDINGESLQCARENLRAAGYENAAFLQGDVAGIMQQRFVKQRLKADVIILDPPRSGCERDVLEATLAAGAAKVIYISCNPATQARDIRYLVERGLTLTGLQPVDMFPQTGHIEVIACLKV